jgi:hypothetical protein
VVPHGVFHGQLELYLSILHPAPARSGVMVVDTNTWTVKKRDPGESGIAFIDAETDELVGIWPSNGGHHDCVIVPTELEHMKHTRSCTL